MPTPAWITSPATQLPTIPPIQALTAGLVSLVPGTLTSSATSNASILAAALSTPGPKSIVTPGIYLVNQRVARVSNTALYLAAGVELKVADGTNLGLFTNAAATNAGILIGVGECTWVYNDGTHYGVRINHTGIGIAYPVGSLICIGGTTSHDYGGIYLVIESASADSIVYGIRANTPDNGSGVPQGLGSTFRVYPVDVNMHIFGPGRINGNGSNNGVDGGGDPTKCLVWTRNAMNVSIQGIAVAPGTTWCLASSNVRNYKVSTIFADTVLAGSTDTVHMMGLHDTAAIEDISGSCLDNMVGLTQDVPTPAGIYDFPNQEPGDMRGITIRRIRNQGRDSATVGIYGPAAFRYNDVTIEDIDGSASSAVLIATYNLTNMNNTNGGVLTIRRVRGSYPGNAVLTAGTMNFDRVIIDDVTTPCAVSPVLTNAAGTIGELNVSGLNLLTLPSNPTAQRTGPGVDLGATNVTALNVEDCQNQTMAANIGFVTHSGAGNIGKASIVKCSATGTGTAAMWKNTGGGTVPTVVYVASTYNGAVL